MQVDVFDPWIDVAEAEHEYGLECLRECLRPGQYAAVVLAVGHRSSWRSAKPAFRRWGSPAPCFST